MRTSHFHGRANDSDGLAKALGTRPAGFHSTIISLILAEVGSARNRAVDQCGRAEALRHWRHPLGAESAAKSGQGRRFDAAGKESTAMVEPKPKIDRRMIFLLSIPAQTPALTYHAQRCLRMPLIVQ